MSTLFLLLALASLIVQMIGLVFSPALFVVTYPITVLLLIAEHFAHKYEIEPRNHHLPD